MLITFLTNAVAFVIILSVVVFVHEFGHYIFAVLNGVQVDEFAIGYGKELFGWNDKRGTRWKICVLPFGGFVKFFADEDESSSIIQKDKLEKLSEEDKKKCLYFKSVWRRIQVVIAGPLFNYLLAIIFFTIFFLFNGVNHFSNKVTIVDQDSIAHKAGILVGDRIIEINNDKVENFEDIQIKLAMDKGNELNIKIEREGRILKKTLTPKIEYRKNIINEEIKTPVIGIGSTEYIYEKVGFLKAFTKSLEQVWFLTTNTLKALGQLLRGQRSFEDMSGPVKIAQYSGKAMQNGILSLIYFTALISASLGLMNILPIPVLDGGHLLFYIIEIIRRKPLDEKIENYLVKFGFYLLMLLMIFVTIKDITGIF